jgi:hypothetical protein
MRVGREYFQWKAGESVIIDDSFEHEVWNRGEGHRVVLILDIWHPELREENRAALVDETRFDGAVAKFMTERGLTKIVDDGDVLRCFFDFASERMLADYLEQADRGELTRPSASVGASEGS